jgi:hypothetical protein
MRGSTLLLQNPPVHPLLQHNWRAEIEADPHKAMADAAMILGHLTRGAALARWSVLKGRSEKSERDGNQQASHGLPVLAQAQNPAHLLLVENEALLVLGEHPG